MQRLTLTVKFLLPQRAKNTVNDLHQWAKNNVLSDVIAGVDIPDNKNQPTVHASESYIRQIFDFFCYC